MKVLFKTAAVVIVLSAILTGGVGCDAFEDIDCEGGNYINVAVSATVSAEVKDLYSNDSVPWSGIPLEIEIIKASGEKVTCNGVTNAYGAVAETCQGTFKVYKEQSVEIRVTPVGEVLLPASMGGGVWDPFDTVYNNRHFLRWSDLEDVGWGETYYWSDDIKIYIFVTRD